jgi:hypothetical protein
MAKAMKASAWADVSCAVCGTRLELWDATTALDGRTVCAANCLGAGIVIARAKPEYQDDEAQDEPPQLDEAAYHDEADER